MLAASLAQLRRLGLATRPWLDELAPAEVRLAWDHAIEQGWSPDTADKYCHRCGVSVGRGAATERGCSHCLNLSLPWHRVERVSSYVSPMNHWIHALKFGRKWQWARPLADSLAMKVDLPPDGANVAVVPVPMPLLRRWRRGFNQSHLLAARIARARRMTFADILHRVKYAQPQTNLDTAHSRLQNVKNNFRIAPVDLTGWHIWLIDDVKTTGATAGACARLLRKAGASRVNLAVVAVADP